MRRLAIIGSGIAGLGLAYYLRDRYEITIYEKESHAGGHSNTVSVEENNRKLPIDTGFMVFNHETYPKLTRLFSELHVPAKKTDMSFSVQHLPRHLEYAGASYSRLFGDRANLFRPRFWRFLLEVDRFNKEALAAVQDPDLQHLSLLSYVRSRRYSEDLLNCYLVPMSSALWSTPAQKVINFPASTLLNFLLNHGLLGRTSQHQWWTIEGGAKEYVARLVATMPQAGFVHSQVNEVRRGARGVRVTTEAEVSQWYDLVVLACHADQSLRLLHDPSDLERKLLSAFAYQRNDTLLHLDQSVMPRAKNCWASWNYRFDKVGATTHYWMNSLQGVSRERNYFVSLDSHHLIDRSLVLKEIVYHHPLFDLNALRAQRDLHKLNLYSRKEQVFFCGSYFGYGFHEDALASSLRLAEQLCGSVLCK